MNLFISNSSISNSRRLNVLALLTLFLLPTYLFADCRIADIYQTAAPERFQNSNDGTIIDNITGLMWRQCVVGLSGLDCAIGSASWLNWSKSLQAASSNRTAGHSDWRLPNIKELASLIEYSCVNPALNQTLFPNAGAIPKSENQNRYIVWSSTPYYDSALIRYLDFGNGSDNSVHRNDVELVRLVRDIQSEN